MIRNILTPTPSGKEGLVLRIPWLANECLSVCQNVLGSFRLACTYLSSTCTFQTERIRADYIAIMIDEKRPTIPNTATGARERWPRAHVGDTFCSPLAWLEKQTHTIPSFCKKFRLKELALHADCWKMTWYWRADFDDEKVVRFWTTNTFPLISCSRLIGESERRGGTPMSR